MLVVTAIATGVLAGATIALVLETRALAAETRRLGRLGRDSELGVTIQPWEEAHTDLAITITNFGPGIATDLSFEIALTGNDGLAQHWSLQELVFPDARQRTILVSDRDIDGLIAADATVTLDWSWTTANDDRRTEHKSVTVKEIAEGYRGSGAMLQRDYLREIPKIREALDKIQRSLVDATRQSDPAGLALSRKEDDVELPSHRGSIRQMVSRAVGRTVGPRA